VQRLGEEGVNMPRCLDSRPCHRQPPGKVNVSTDALWLAKVADRLAVNKVPAR
jgi:hypothetical protein